MMNEHSGSLELMLLVMDGILDYHLHLFCHFAQSLPLGHGPGAAGWRRLSVWLPGAGGLVLWFLLEPWGRFGKTAPEKFHQMLEIEHGKTRNLWGD